MAQHCTRVLILIVCLLVVYDGVLSVLQGTQAREHHHSTHSMLFTSERSLVSYALSWKLVISLPGFEDSHVPSNADTSLSSTIEIVY